MPETVFSALLENASLLLGMVVVFDLSTAGRSPEEERQGLRQVLVGLIGGAFSVGLMLLSHEVEPGVRFDARSVLLSVCGLFLGVVPTGIAAVIAAAFRFWQGGAGTWTGMAVVLVTGGLGVAWGRWRRGALSEIRWQELYGFGVTVHVVVLLMMLWLPGGGAWRVVPAVAFPMLVIFPVATAALGLLLVHRLQRVRQQSELAASAARHRSLFDANPQAMWVYDRDSLAFLAVNDAAVRSYGYPREEFLRMTVRDIRPEEDIPAFLDICRSQTESPRQSEPVRHRRKDGETIMVQVHSSPVEWMGNPARLVLATDITDRLRAEAQVRLQTTALNAAANAVVITDTRGDIQWVNPAFTALTGYTFEEAVGKNPRVLKSGMHDPEYYREMWSTILAGGVWRGEIINRNKQGQCFTEEAIITPVRDTDGTITHFIAIKQDVTARKRAEQAHRESEDRFREIADHVGDWVWEVDARGVYTYASQAVERILGYRPEELVGEVRMADLLDPEDLQTLERLATEVLGPRQPFKDFRSRYLCRDGKTVMIETSGTPVFDGGGQLRGYRGVSTDVTERDRIAEQLRSQAALLDLAHDAIAVEDFQTGVRYWNKGSERLTGWTAAEAVGKSAAALMQIDPVAVKQAERTLLDEGQWRGELEMGTRGGGRVSVMVRCSLVRDDAGRPQAVLFIGTDITEQKRLEAQFLRAQRVEGIGALASGIAHDLNNILAPILMTAPVVRDLVTDPECRMLLETIEESAKRGGDIVQQVLTFARGAPSARVPLPVRHLMRDMARIVQETFPRSIRVRVVAPEDLWMVLGDATQLHQTLMNLCLNARDAMPEGGVLTLAARNVQVDEAMATQSFHARPGPYVCLSVADTGRGIPSEHLERIFDPFFTTKELGKGTGLGLSTVDGIVRGHEGFVRVESQLDRGTTFETYLPAVQKTTRGPQVQQGDLPPPANGELVLVVDDEASLRDSLRRHLETAGYSVVTASNGAEGLRVFSGHQEEIRAALVDLMMPVMNGATLIRAIRVLAPDLVVIGMTGLPDPEAEAPLAGLRLTALLTKPFPGVDLQRVLHQALVESGRSGSSEGAP